MRPAHKELKIGQFELNFKQPFTWKQSQISCCFVEDVFSVQIIASQSKQIWYKSTESCYGSTHEQYSDSSHVG